MNNAPPKFPEPLHDLISPQMSALAFGLARQVKNPERALLYLIGFRGECPRAELLSLLDTAKPSRAEVHLQYWINRGFFEPFLSGDAPVRMRRAQFEWLQSLGNATQLQFLPEEASLRLLMAGEGRKSVGEWVSESVRKEEGPPVSSMPSGADARDRSIDRSGIDYSNRKGVSISIPDRSEARAHEGNPQIAQISQIDQNTLAEKFWKTVGEHERHGLSGMFFQRMLLNEPGKVENVLKNYAAAEPWKQSGHKPGAFIQVALRNAL